MMIPHILSNDEYGKVVDELNLLFENYDYEADKGSFFKELTATNMPAYFSNHETIILKERFDTYHEKDFKKKKSE